MLPASTILEHTDFLSGALLLIDKPRGWTSFDVVNKVRYLLRQKYQVKNIKVGHSGTLDPLATGLLLICTGKWTKELTQLTGLDKKYLAKIRLGEETATYDAEGEIIASLPVPAISKMELENVLQSFIGDIDQYPPAYSAIKKDGKRLYELARAGKEVVVDARKVKVYAIEIIDASLPEIEILIHCGSGFYVRSLAHDLGQKFGCGAHLSGLIRTAIGSYNLEEAKSMNDIVREIPIPV